ncbi:hypothetical protein TNCV_710631 [Trichonephila clavipes]|nr:hypothetical protein TNCV_710631 [Trichonephila clavipes]
MPREDFWRRPGPTQGCRAIEEEGLGSNPGEDMDVCQCIEPLRHQGTLNRRQVASPLMWLVEGEERWEATGNPPGFSPFKLGWSRAKSYCHLYGAQSQD